MFRTKASTYAILAVTEIAKRQAAQPAGVQAGEIARFLDLPAAYAAKVLTQLARVSILRSDRGPRGGFRLMRPPNVITLLEIIEAVDGTIVGDVSFNQAHREARETLRIVDEVFGHIVADMRAVLARETVARLIRAETPATSFIQAT